MDSAGSRAMDILVLQDCIRRLRQAVPTPFHEAMDVAAILVNLRKTSTTLGEADMKLLGDVLALAVARAEAAKQQLREPEPEPEPEPAVYSRATTPPKSRAGTPPARAPVRSPPVESPGLPTQPSSSLQRRDELRMASWNMKHLSDSTALAEGAKKDFAKLVDVLRRFDFVAIQEITNAQRTLVTLCAQLPGRWDFAVSPKFQQLNGRGCPECLAFLWRTDRVHFTGPVDEDGRPKGYLVTESDTRTPAVHYWHRPPFFSSFRAGELEFVALTCHVTFSGAPETAQREAFEATTQLDGRHDDGAAASEEELTGRRQQPQRGGGQAMDKLDGRRLEVENLAAASVLLREQLARSRGRGKALPTLFVLADFNLDSDDPAFSVMERAGMRPLVDTAGGTMVKSSHAYDNIFSSSAATTTTAAGGGAGRGVGCKLRSGAVDLAAVMGEADSSTPATAALLREKSARSAAYDHLSDHKPVFVDLCCSRKGDGGGGGGIPAALSQQQQQQQQQGWQLAPIRMSRVGDIGRTYTRK